jgi:hypothetical protein
MFKVSDTIILPVSFCLWWKQKGKGGSGHMRLDMQALVMIKKPSNNGPYTTHFTENQDEPPPSPSFN